MSASADNASGRAGAGEAISLATAAGRFERFGRIDWWDQQRLADARVLVVGAGALGNEVVKDLALLGVGRLAVADMDAIESSNLCRSVLFRDADVGRPKAEAAAAAATEIYPGLRAIPLVGNVLGEVGLGWFRWAEAIVGALDNREARLFVNESAWRVGRPWFDGGIEVLNGVVRGFAPPASACYECTMGAADWQAVEQRRSCSLLARRALSAGGTPTTPTTASVIGAIQAQEVVKSLHGLQTLAGAGFVFEGLTHGSYPVSYPVKPDCPWHEAPPPIEAADELDGGQPMAAVWAWAERRLGPLEAIDLARELVERLSCPKCGREDAVRRPIDAVREDEAVCPGCGAERVPRFVHSLGRGSGLLELSGRELGLPRWDIVWARGGGRALGVELAGDRPAGI